MKQEISSTTWFLMYGFALIIDGLQFLIEFTPFVGFIVGAISGPVFAVVGLAVFWAWFKSHEVSIFESPVVKWTIICFILEFIPGLDAAPGWLGFVKLARNALKGSAGGVY